MPWIGHQTILDHYIHTFIHSPKLTGNLVHSEERKKPLVVITEKLHVTWAQDQSRDPEPCGRHCPFSNLICFRKWCFNVLYLRLMKEKRIIKVSWSVKWQRHDDAVSSIASCLTLTLEDVTLALDDLSVHVLLVPALVSSALVLQLAPKFEWLCSWFCRYTAAALTRTKRLRQWGRAV